MAGVGRARPGENPTRRRVASRCGGPRAARCAGPRAAGSSPRHADVDVRRARPGPADEDAVAGCRRAPEEVRVHVCGRRHVGRTPRGRVPRWDCDRAWLRPPGMKREEARAPVNEVRDVDEAHDRRVATAPNRASGAGAPTKSNTPRPPNQRADEPRRRPPEPPPDLGHPEGDGHVHQRRDGEGRRSETSTPGCADAPAALSRAVRSGVLGTVERSNAQQLDQRLFVGHADVTAPTPGPP